MSRERRNISQRKIRRIQRSSDDSTFKMETESESKIKGMKPNTLMYYTKVGFGAGTGILSGVSFNWLDISPDLWFVILLGGLIVCIAFIRYGLKISAEDVDLKRLLFSGTFTFILLFIVITSLIWMIPGPRFNS